MAESREAGLSALFMVGLLSPGTGLLGIHHYLSSRLLPLKVCVWWYSCHFSMFKRELDWNSSEDLSFPYKQLECLQQGGQTF